MRRGALVALLALGLLPTVPAAAQDVACVAPLPADQAPATDPGLHRISRGEGVRVAVIDTGVAPHPDLGPVEPIADLVSPWAPDPLFDCDGHGTVVAGVLRGVAPGAQILSIRQSSAHYRDAGGTLETLTQALHHAVDAGSRVINISVVSCLDASVLLDAAPLHHALQRAEDAGAVVIAAVDNAGGACAPGMVVLPAHAETVLAVAAVDESDPHALAAYALPGGQLAAPGRVPVGLSPTGEGYAAGTLSSQGGQAGFEGTSFAAPVVSGVAALLAERHPHDTAAQLRERLVQAAEPGHGVVDRQAGVAHLTGDYARGERELSVAAPPEERSGAPGRAGLVLAAALVVALLIGPVRAGWPRV